MEELGVHPHSSVPTSSSTYSLILEGFVFLSIFHEESLMQGQYATMREILEKQENCRKKRGRQQNMGRAFRLEKILFVMLLCVIL